MKIDATDRKIIYELEQDCRRSLGEIAKRVRLSKQTLHYRIDRLVRGGAITQFTAVLNVSKLGLVNHEVWIQLEVLPDEKRDTFIRFLVKHKSTRWVVDCSGKIDVAIAICSENVVQFNNIWQNIQDQFPGYVKNYFLNISLEHYTYPRAHLIGEKENHTIANLGGEPKLINLDEVEIKILELLAKDARMPLIQIASQAETSENTIRTKIKRLEKENVIQTYTAIVQPTNIGLINFEILVSTQNLTKEKEKELETYCLLNPYVNAYLKLIGKFDRDIAFDAVDNAHFQKILAEFRSRFAPIIKEFEFVYITRIYKFDYFAGLKKD